jgi:NOL1/NOP2/sun family putative RNA methylase
MEFPAEFCRRMERLLRGSYPDFLNAYLLSGGRGLRVNTLKCSVDAFQRLFPLPLAPVPFSPMGFLIHDPLKAGADPLHHAGAYYMQEPSAMSAATVLAPRPGERILDLCAAPGGKTTQIASYLRGTGLLWANEYVRSRAQILLQNLERCGVGNSVVSNAEPAVLAARLPDWFDGVLVDAPCSGEGMFRKEPAALEQWSLDNIRLCARRQKDILLNAAQMVRPGGRLVFSTCTFAPEENEWSVIRFLQARPDFQLADCGVSFGQPGFSAERIASFALPEDRLPEVPVPLDRCRRILPQHGGEGHFVALFRRREDGSPPFVAPYVPPQHDTYSNQCAELYDKCFSSVPCGRFATFGTTIRLLPEGLPDLQGLGVLAAGVAAGELRGGAPARPQRPGKQKPSPATRVEPCHALFLAARPEDCRSLLNLSLDDPRLPRFLRGEEIPAENCRGWTGVAVEGIMTGFGKASGGTLKNRYPKGLRMLG